jgi:hypothetical protein
MSSSRPASWVPLASNNPGCRTARDTEGPQVDAVSGTFKLASPARLLLLR